MEIPVQVTFRNMDPSPAVEARIRERVDRLGRFGNRLLGFRVVVEAPHRHHHQGKLFHVRIDASIRGGEVVVSRDHGDNHAHEDVYVAIRDAFDALRRRLQEHFERRRGHVKRPAESRPVARVSRIFPDEGYGFLDTPDGRQVYFDQRAVQGGGFAALEVGERVSFVEEEGEKGPQAAEVVRVGRG